MQNITLQIKIQWGKREWICIWKQRVTLKSPSPTAPALNMEGICQENQQVQQISSFSIKQKQEDLYLEMTETEEVEKCDGKYLISHIYLNLWTVG